MPKIVIKGQEPVEPRIEYYLEASHGYINLMALGIDREYWCVGSLNDDGTMTLVGDIAKESGIKVDSEGKIVIRTY